MSHDRKRHVVDRIFVRSNRPKSFVFVDYLAAQIDLVMIVATDQHFQAIDLFVGKEITNRVGDTVVGFLSSKDVLEIKDKAIIQMTLLPGQFAAKDRDLLPCPRLEIGFSIELLRKPW